MRETISRRALLRLAAGAAAAWALLPRAARAARERAPELHDLSVASDLPFAGDRPLFATVCPQTQGRRRAVLRFRLDRRASVRMEAVRKGQRREEVVWTRTLELGAGRHEVAWRPDPRLAAGTYLVRLSVESGGTARRTYGGQRPSSPERSRAPVVRILGIEASFDERSYAPGQAARLRIAADARTLTVQIFRSGPEAEYSDRADEMSGVPVADAFKLDWRRSRTAPRTVRMRVGEWQTGMYFARIDGDDGRVGFAPFIVRPASLGAARVAVVLPTNSWQAYNYYDADGDGWGDTWYAGGSPPVVLDRPYLNRGVPPRFRRYDLPFIKWLQWTGKAADFLSDEDLARVPSGDELRRLYDLVVFPGHSEYVTAHAYDVVERFRDLGGNLIFLSANNFFWRVDRQGNAIRRVKLWRDLGRPEARLIGVQYRANDDGSRQGVFYVTNSAAAPWLFEGTGLTDGSTIGEYVGGYGIEIDTTTKDSPPGTQVLAIIPNLFGLGLNAEMTYYEAPSGAKVFAAGVLDFGGSVTFWPVRRMLENLWRRLAPPAYPPESSAA